MNNEMKYIYIDSKNIENIICILKNEFLNAKCGLNYNEPIELVCALILAAQCTDERVNKIIPILFNKYKSVYELSKAKIDDIEKIIKPCGFYKNKAKSILNTSKLIVEKYDGKVPNTMLELVKLSGIGRKSANIILQECFNKIEGIAVDTHVTRLARKMGISKANTPIKIEEELLKKIDRKYWMDVNHLFVLQGRKYCIARRPKCEICPLKNNCPKNK